MPPQRNRRVLDEHRVGHGRFGGQAVHVTAKRCQALYLCFMLRLGSFEADWFAFEVRQFALFDAGADVAGDGNEHGGIFLYL